MLGGGSLGWMRVCGGPVGKRVGLTGQPSADVRGSTSFCWHMNTG